MLQKLYVHNFRCLENFELRFKAMPSALLIGKNATGKSTTGVVLEILQRISRGVNKVGQLVSFKDFARGRSDVPIRFEIEVLLNQKIYQYILVLDLPENFKELRVSQEKFSVAGEPIYSREEAQVILHSNSKNNEAKFLVDWHLVALPIIQERSQTDPLYLFKTWLSHTIILDPIPSLMTGKSEGETLKPEKNGSNFGEWFVGLLGRYPAAYSKIDKYLRQVLPDINDFLNHPTSENSKITRVRFVENSANLSVDFDNLSDGEKCFFLGAVVLAANEFYGPLFCFWDEPERYLSLSEVGHFIASLRSSFQNDSQILITSHNPEAIRKFSDENTLVLYRKSHLEPTRIKLLDEIRSQGNNVKFEGDLIDTLISGDLELWV